MSKKNLNISVWISTARPKTLPLALASIITGSALAYHVQQFSWAIFLLAILTALFLQILSNFANDFGDHVKGSDTSERIGPLRGIQQGELSIEQLKKGLIITIIASLISGLMLIIVACNSWSDLFTFILLGLLAIIAAITYTVGKKPYGYIGLGDLSVVLFFGWLGVGGSFYLQTKTLSSPILLIATASGLLAAAVLNINNLRDLEQDRKVGKNTLAVRLGPHSAKIYHFAILTLTMIIHVAFIFNFDAPSSLATKLILLGFPLLIWHCYKVFKIQQPIHYRPLLAEMALIALFINMIFSIGWIIA